MSRNCIFSKTSSTALLLPKQIVPRDRILTKIILIQKKWVKYFGPECGTVGKAVAFDAGYCGFESKSGYQQH